MTLALVAVLAVLPFASTARAAAFCNMAEQLTLDKMDMDCKEEFVSTLKNEQDRIDMARVLNTWKAPEGLEITTFESYLQVSLPNKEPLRISYLSFHPLMIMINDKIYTDASNEPSWSRRIGKIFAEAAKANTVQNRFSLPAWMLIDTAEAFTFGPPAEVTERVGYAYSVNLGDKSQPITGSSRDLVAAGKLSSSEKYTPDYAGGFFEKLAYNAASDFHSGATQNMRHNEFECADGVLKKGSYRVKINGEEKSVSARLVSKNEVAVRGLLPDNKEIKVRVNPQGLGGVKCVDTYVTRKSGCRGAWNELAKSDKDIRKAYVQATKTRGRHVTCRSLGAKEADCRAFFAEKFPQNGQLISDDGEGKNSTIATCKDTECKQTEPLNNRLLLAMANPAAKDTLRAESAAQVADASGAVENQKQTYIDMLEANGVKNAAKLCRKLKNGSDSCALPNRDRKRIQKEDSDAWAQIVGQREEVNASKRGRDSKAAAAPKDENTKLAAKGTELRARLQEVAIGMMIYSAPCSDPAAAKQAKGWLSGSDYKGAQPRDAVQ